MRALLAVALLPLPAAAQVPAGLLVSGYSSNRVHVFDEVTGAHLADLAVVPGPQDLEYGPDGHLYVCAEAVDRVVRFDGQTGASLGPFVADLPATPADEAGGLDGPTGMAWGADGLLYVASFETDEVLRFDATGAFVDVFVPAGSGGLNGPDLEMTFGPDGHLWVPSFWNDRVLRYDGATGAFLDEVVSPGETGMNAPRDLVFRSDGVLFASSWSSGQALRYDLDGNALGPFATAVLPTGLAFGPGDGHLYVASDNADRVTRHDKTTGALVDVFVSPGAGGLDGATGVAFWPRRDLGCARLAPGTTGAFNALTVDNATPAATVVVGVGLATTSLVVPCAVSPLGVQDPALFVLPTDAAGEATIGATLSAAAAGLTLVLQAYDPTTCRLSNLVVQTIG